MKCILLHGITNSGKSTIAAYLNEILISHDYAQTSGNFEQYITKTNSNVQLLVIDECKSFTMFGSGKLDDAKKLLEGNGKNTEIKNKHPFTGFKGCFTFITT